MDITGNDSGQGFTSTSTCTHVQAIRVSAAVLRRYDADVPPTAVGATPSMLECTFNAFISARIVVKNRTQWVPLSAASVKIRCPTTFEGTQRCLQLG